MSITRADYWDPQKPGGSRGVFTRFHAQGQRWKLHQGRWFVPHPWPLCSSSRQQGQTGPRGQAGRAEGLGSPVERGVLHVSSLASERMWLCSRVASTLLS